MKEKRLECPCNTCDKKEKGCLLLESFGECARYTEWMYKDMGKDPAEDGKFVNRVKRFLFG